MKLNFTFLLFVVLLFTPGISLLGQVKDDPYLTKLYWSLNDSPMQRKLRNIKPFPVGVVYYQQMDHNLDSIRNTFQVIRQHGFTALKQIVITQPDVPVGMQEQVYNAALDVGLSPWYYGEGGWQEINPQLLQKLGIKTKLSAEQMPMIQADPKMVKYQTTLLRDRIGRMHSQPPKPKEMGEPGRNTPYLTPRLLPAFTNALKEQYGTLPELKKAWGYSYTFQDNIDSFEDAAKLLEAIGTDQYGNRIGRNGWSIRPARDAMRFQADLKIKDYTEFMKTYYAFDPEEPNRTGGHQLFENQPLNGWDLEGQAKSATIGGSFYASIHLAHHFFLVVGEVVRPVYMQARTVADMFKGGWSAAWESTGGPTQWSGYQGYTVDGNLMQTLMLSYVAAGLKGIGLWTWNSRDTGWEAGEYALTNLQGKPTDRAVVAGRIAQAIQAHRFELWSALDEPLVGILYSWENEAIMGRLSLGAYPLSTPVQQTTRDAEFRQFHAEGKIGISRALMNQNIPFEYVTERDLNAGLAGRYRVIYLPSVLALSEETVQQLEQYVREGGHLVADMPLLMLDNYGRLNKYRKGEVFEKVFGFQVTDYFNTFNAPKSLESVGTVNGQFADIVMTHGKVSQRFTDGSPAVIQAQYGKGRTTVFNFEASRSVFKPGNSAFEKFIVDPVLRGTEKIFSVEGSALVFRRSSNKADHYFIINEGLSTTVSIKGNNVTYTRAEDVLKKQSLSVSRNALSVNVPSYSGSWIRVEKQ